MKPRVLSRRNGAAVLAALAALALVRTAGAVMVTVDASQVVRTVDSRMFGINATVWDSALKNGQSLAPLQAMGIRFLRFPGGSTADAFDWRTNTNIIDRVRYSPWGPDFDEFVAVARSIGAPMIITTNYGSGTAQDAADWVTYSNVTKHYGVEYWEIGNENYGSWEVDLHPLKWDPVTYATEAEAYLTRMKAADPTIKIGVVGQVGEDALDAQSPVHEVTNPRTGLTHHGWTPVMLTTLRTLGVTPDFLIHHRYPQTPGAESDAGLLQNPKTWPEDVADLRRQLTDYLGAAGAGVELIVTENNSVAINPGRQSTSLVNGLFLADTLGQVLRTELSGYLWWALRQGSPRDAQGRQLGNFSPSLYGWRVYGDYGVLSYANDVNPVADDPHPTYYAFKLLTHFARGGDQIVHVASDDPLLSAYGAKRADGTLALLVINKSPTESAAVNVALAGFTPTAQGTVYSYGIPQDDAARTASGSTDIAERSLAVGAAGFAATFAPYSMSVLLLAPANASAPLFTARPRNRSALVGSPVMLDASAAGNPAPVYQWERTGLPLAGATGAMLAIEALQPADAGLYRVVAVNSAGARASDHAVIGPAITVKFVGDGSAEVATDVRHPNGNLYDQVLLGSPALALTADAGEVTRTSFIDENDDIVQVEFAGPGTLTLVLDNPSGPALPVNYHQDLRYMKGHAGIVITGATEQTNVGVFTVGRATAHDPTGRFDVAEPIGPDNRPENNGNPIFQVPGSPVYDAVADIAFIAIASANGKFGGVRTGNARYTASRGLTGIYAPGVQFAGPVYVGDIDASGAATTPVIQLGAVAGDTWITGGDLAQTNGQPVRVTGLMELKFRPGTNSNGDALPAQTCRAVLEEDGEDVTAQIAVNP